MPRKPSSRFLKDGMTEVEEASKKEIPQEENNSLGITDLPEDLQEAILNLKGTDLQVRALNMFNLLLNNPYIEGKDLFTLSKMSNRTYYHIMLKNPIIRNYIIDFRRQMTFDDVVSTYGIMLKLRHNLNPTISFNACKFILENIGQDFGFGKKEANTTSLKLELVDKTAEKQTYTNEDLSSV